MRVATEYRQSKVCICAGSPGGRLALFLVGKYCISIVVTGVYVYTGELFPTRYRHRLFSFASTVGRLGSILAPLTPALVSYFLVVLLIKIR